MAMPIPLGDGDPTWVFGDTLNRDALGDVLAEAASCIEGLARHLHTRAGWTGAGLEYDRLPAGEFGPARTDLQGYAENAGTTFLARLETVPDGWEVSASISVMCDVHLNCGGHPIETWGLRTAADAPNAARNLLSACQWLLERGTTESAGYWPAHDGMSKHPCHCRRPECATKAHP